MNKVLVIVGPTASGKSDLGVRLAQRFKGEVISADSRQVYKGLNVGTGKITRQEMRGVKHHLLDVASPKQHFTVADYQKIAENNLRYIVSYGKLPIVVGGTGFYIDALACKETFPDVPPNKKLRTKLAQYSNDTLFKLIRKKDPRRAKTLDPNNKVRLIRALEIIEALGKVPKITSNKQLTTYNFIYIGLIPANLDKRIRERLLKRLPAMIREGIRLHRQGLSYKRMHELGLEYRYLAFYLQGKLNKQEMAEKLYFAIRQFAKRQMTWFKRNKKIEWFKPEDYKKIEKYARAMLR